MKKDPKNNDSIPDVELNDPEFDSKFFGGRTDPKIKVEFEEYETKKQFDNASRAFFIVLWLSVAFVISSMVFSLLFPFSAKVGFSIDWKIIALKVDPASVSELPMLGKTAIDFMNLGQDFLYILVVVFGLIFVVKGRSSSDIGGLLEKVTKLIIAIKTPKLATPTKEGNSSNKEVKKDA